MDDKQQNFYKRLLIIIRVKCLKQGIKKSEFCLKQGRKISDICLKQGQGTRGRAAPPHPGIYWVPHPPSGYGPWHPVMSLPIKAPNFLQQPERKCNAKGSESKWVKKNERRRAKQFGKLNRKKQLKLLFVQIWVMRMDPFFVLIATSIFLFKTNTFFSKTRDHLASWQTENWFKRLKTTYFVITPKIK